MEHTNVRLAHSVNFLSVSQTAQLQHTRSIMPIQGSSSVQKPATDFNQAAGTASWENANYKINFAENHSQIFVQNKNTGENYTVWGDPHVTVGDASQNGGPKHSMKGSHDFDFKKDVRFTLEDGTQLHVKTTPWKDDNGNIRNGQTLASQVMIQDGLSDHAFKITGLDGNGHTLGDMTAQEMTGLEVSEADRINEREGLQMIELAGAQNKGFGLMGRDGQYDELGSKHGANTSQITAMENFLGQHAIPMESMSTPSMLTTNQQVVMNQLDQFMQMAMNMFSQQFQVPTGGSVFQQISTMIQGQTHSIGFDGFS